MLPTLVRNSRTDSAWVRTEREPAIILKTTADAQANTVEQALAIATSLEIS
jgi:hypothetical protein